MGKVAESHGPENQARSSPVARSHYISTIRTPCYVTRVSLPSIHLQRRAYSRSLRAPSEKKSLSLPSRRVLESLCRIRVYYRIRKREVSTAARPNKLCEPRAALRGSISKCRPRSLARSAFYAAMGKSRPQIFRRSLRTPRPRLISESAQSVGELSEARREERDRGAAYR